MAEIAAKKYSGLRIAELRQYPDFDVQCHAILLRMCAASGWKMPQHEVMMSALVKEFQLYLQEACPDLTPEEVLYSIRSYALDIQDWGKDINLQLINGPISDYRAARVELSRLEEQSAKSAEKPQKEEEAIESWESIWERLKSGEIKGSMLDLVPWAAIYDWLSESGQIKPKNAEKWRWMRMACTSEIGRLSMKKESLQATVEEKEMLERLKVIDWVPGKFPEVCKGVNHLIAPSKVVAVKELLTKI